MALSQITVLLVDDVAGIRRMYEAYFESKGVGIITAADGMSALMAVGNERPDIIVLDLSMPAMSGWDVIRHLKQEPWTRTIPIIALSGLDERESALEAGANSYVAKPCLPVDLHNEILRLLGKAGPPASTAA
jgi:two-component system cell cycle response regulator DivK